MRVNWTRLVLTWVVFSGLRVAALAADAPYVPSEDFVTTQMLQLVDVTSEDTVYDLGSGDGRVVIAAARDFNATGVGIEIDTDLVRQSRENAEEAGVADRVTFVEGDLFKADISSATVVTLYLLQSVNLRLRPKLLAELKPGTRVVSNDFNMGDWKPWKEERLGSRTIYAWIIPERPKVPAPAVPPSEEKR